MVKNDAIENEQALAAQTHQRGVDIAHVLPMRLQALTLTGKPSLPPTTNATLLAPSMTAALGAALSQASIPSRMAILPWYACPLPN